MAITVTITANPEPEMARNVDSTSYRIEVDGQTIEGTTASSARARDIAETTAAAYGYDADAIAWR